MTCVAGSTDPVRYHQFQVSRLKVKVKS